MFNLAQRSVYFAINVKHKAWNIEFDFGFVIKKNEEIQKNLSLKLDSFPIKILCNQTLGNQLIQYACNYKFFGNKGMTTLFLKKNLPLAFSPSPSDCKKHQLILLRFNSIHA